VESLARAALLSKTSAQPAQELPKRDGTIALMINSNSAIASLGNDELLASTRAAIRCLWLPLGMTGHYS